MKIEEDIKTLPLLSDEKNDISFPNSKTESLIIEQKKKNWLSRTFGKMGPGQFFFLKNLYIKN